MSEIQPDVDIPDHFLKALIGHVVELVHVVQDNPASATMLYAQAQCAEKSYITAGKDCSFSPKGKGVFLAP